MTDTNYTYEDAYRDAKAMCEEALKMGRISNQIAVELSRKLKISVALLYNCANYITNIIGDEKEADRVLKSLGVTTEALNSILE